MEYRSTKTVNVAPWIQHFKEQAAGKSVQPLTGRTKHGRHGSRLIIVGTPKTDKAKDQLPLHVVEPIQQETQQARAELVQDIKDTAHRMNPQSSTTDRKAKTQASKRTKRVRDILSN